MGIMKFWLCCIFKWLWVLSETALIEIFDISNQKLFKLVIVMKDSSFPFILFYLFCFIILFYFLLIIYFFFLYGEWEMYEKLRFLKFCFEYIILWAYHTVHKKEKCVTSHKMKFRILEVLSLKYGKFNGQQLEHPSDKFYPK